MRHKNLSWLLSVVVVLAGCSFPLSATESPATQTPVAAAPTAVIAPSATARPVSAAPLDWQPCDSTITDVADFECAVLTVPLDYAAPDGEQIGIQIIRLPATETSSGAQRLPLVVNPGGPGGSGVEWATRSSGGAADLHAELGLTGFDIISFDPRGVGLSGGLFCQSDAEIDRYRYPDSTPDTPTEEAFLIEARDAFKTACKAKYGDSLQFYSTTNTARDMDKLREAIGADQLSYIGGSIGCAIG
ncbi:MAG: Carboxylesterase precursor, partial [Chloroflexota bacterium]